MKKELVIKHVRLTFDEWNKSIQKKNVYLYEDKDNRYGFIEIVHVKKRQVWSIFGREIIVADNGYKWLVISPKHANYVITMYMDNKMKPILWYIDIIDEKGTDRDGVFYYNDMFLDIIVSSTFQIVEDDRDELEMALKQGIISNEQYKMVNEIACALTDKLEKEPTWILDLSQDILRKIKKEIQENNCLIYNSNFALE
ncbi:MAG: DUF402 domain-containing protein [Lachnospiraceae bacterium]